MSLVFAKGPGLAASILLCAALLASCGPSKHSKQAGAARYKLTGRVVSVDKASGSVIVDGNDIPGFMSAMTMSYKVKNKTELDALEAGDRVAADLVGENDDYWLEHITVVERSPAPGKPSAALHIPQSGEPVPDFGLLNQSGMHISLQQYRGKALIVTFIYTRCPFPDFCPRVSGQFAELDRQLAGDSALYGKTHLLSISFDPAADTPHALRDYGGRYLKSRPLRFDHWEFAVAPASELPSIAGYFGLTYSAQEGGLTHSLSTAVIGPDGRIFGWYHGDDWTSADLVRDAAEALHAAA